MPRNWIKLFQRIGPRGDAATGSGFPYQHAGPGGDDAPSTMGQKTEHPTWLIPAYLRWHRSGDRMYR